MVHSGYLRVDDPLSGSLWLPKSGSICFKLKQNSGDSNQDYEKIYAWALTLWKDRKPVEEFIRKSLKLDDSQPLSSHSYQHSPQSQRFPDTATISSSPINSQPQLSHTFSFPISSPQSRNSYITPSRNRPPVLNDHPTDTRTFVELLDEQKQKGPPSYYYLEDFTPPSHY